MGTHPVHRKTPRLQRRLGVALLCFYGLGTTIGAGIYVLVGKVAGLAGTAAPVAFLVSAAVATFTALSFAELASRFPKSAGEAVYVQRAFGLAHLSLVVGLTVMLAGITSSAAIFNGAGGYLSVLLPLPTWSLSLLLIAVIGAVATCNIAASVTFAAVLTVVEVAGLLLVIFGGFLGEAVVAPQSLGTAAAADGWFAAIPIAGVLSGAVLAFYAFLGFEDMVNVAEETRDPQRTIPRAIVLTLILTTLLYLLVTLAALRVVPVDELANSEAPLALVWQRSGGPPQLLALIGIVATINGALIQMIMASRVAYGLADQGWLPAILAKVTKKSGAPLPATLAAIAAIAVFAMAVPLESLARATSMLTLAIFTLINCALIQLKHRAPQPSDGPSVPLAIPVIGAFSSAALLAWAVSTLV